MEEEGGSCLLSAAEVIFCKIFVAMVVVGEEELGGEKEKCRVLGRRGVSRDGSCRCGQEILM